jgi:hypothetical protein
VSTALQSATSYKSTIYKLTTLTTTRLQFKQSKSPSKLQIWIGFLSKTRIDLGAEV